MKKILTTALLLAIGSASLSAVPNKEAETKTPPVQLAQVGPVHHSVNNFGTWFWGTTPEIAIAECQAYTPVGGLCYYRGFW